MTQPNGSQMKLKETKYDEHSLLTKKPTPCILNYKRESRPEVPRIYYSSIQYYVDFFLLRSAKIAMIFWSCCK